MELKFTSDFYSDFIALYLDLSEERQFDRLKTINNFSSGIKILNKLKFKDDLLVSEIDINELSNTLKTVSYISSAITNALYENSDIGLMINELKHIYKDIKSSEELSFYMDSCSRSLYKLSEDLLLSIPEDRVYLDLKKCLPLSRKLLILAENDLIPIRLGR